MSVEDERRGEMEMREMRVNHKNIHACTHTYTNTSRKFEQKKVDQTQPLSFFS